MSGRLPGGSEAGRLAGHGQGGLARLVAVGFPFQGKVAQVGALGELAVTLHAQAVHGRLGGEEAPGRSEEHTSELQSPCNLVCRLLLEKKKCLFSMLIPAVLTLVMTNVLNLSLSAMT